MDMTALKRIFSDMPTLYTKRLILRRMTKYDADDMYEYSKEPEVTKYLLWTPHPNRRYTLRYLAYLSGRYREGSFYDWAITDRLSGKMIGTCGFTRFYEEHNSAECGYVVNPKYWGNGVAPEALLAVMKFGFLTLGLHRIECRYMIENSKSRRVMEKVGMTYEGTMRDAVLAGENYKTVGVYSILYDEFVKLYGG